MPNRRKFLLTTVSTLVIGCSGAAILLLRRTGIVHAPSEPEATGTATRQPAQLATGTPFLPSQTEPTPTEKRPVLLENPSCTAAAQFPIPRSEWGALDPDIRAGRRGEHGPYSADNPSGWLVYDQPLEQVYHTIIVHHSALPLSDGPMEIQRLHLEEKGFADIGYHFLIDEKGRLFEGRSLGVRGAHTYGANYGSIGICLTGNFEVIHPAQPQMEMLQSLTACLVTRFPAINRLAGHQDYNPNVTLCPGSNLASFLPQIAAQFELAYGA